MGEKGVRVSSWWIFLILQLMLKRKVCGKLSKLWGIVEMRRILEVGMRVGRNMVMLECSAPDFKP
jgi:hypothetical protein